MYDTFAQWTYSGGEPERSLTKDEMLDGITLYWWTNSAISSAQLYWENNTNNFNAVEQKTADISIPVALTVFPDEIYQAPRSWTERAYHKLIYFNEVNKGGHFARHGKSRNSSLRSSGRRSNHCANRRDMEYRHNLCPHSTPHRDNGRSDYSQTIKMDKLLTAVLAHTADWRTGLKPPGSLLGVTRWPLGNK